MGFRKLRIAEITSPGAVDGYPVYGEFKMLQDVAASEELNSVDITITKVTKTKTLQADDKEDERTKVVRADGTLRVFDCDRERAADMFGFELDINDNLIEKVNKTRKRFGAFFEGKTTKDARYQKYLYDVEFLDPVFTTATDTGEDSTTMELPFKLRIVVTPTGDEIMSATVYPDNTGWVAAEPTTMYKEAKTAGGGGGA